LQQLAEIADRGGRHPQGEAGQQAQVAQPNMQGALERIIQLEERVAVEPENAMSWARLGRAYLNTQREADARRAYARAYSLEPENIVILATYARLVFSGNPRDPEGKAVKLFRQLHEMDPEHPDGLWFLGLAAYSEGNLERTTELWTKLLGILPVESESHTAVRNALDQVRGLPNTQK
jgi:cytochrome c-type biogenesis protein CcmH